MLDGVAVPAAGLFLGAAVAGLLGSLSGLGGGVLIVPLLLLVAVEMLLQGLGRRL